MVLWLHCVFTHNWAHLSHRRAHQILAPEELWFAHTRFLHRHYGLVRNAVKSFSLAAEKATAIV
jgi:hypothetical protein